MVNFAICDDDSTVLDNIYSKLGEVYKDECTIEKFLDGESLLRKNKDKLFDVVFLDIDMPGLSGFEVAEKIRQDNSYVKILFVTNKSELVFNSFRYETFRFIRKSCFDDEFKEAIEALQDFFDKINEYILFKTPHGEVRYKVREIMYLDVQGHTLKLHVEGTAIQILGTMDYYDKRLTGKGFIRTHKSFLVNFSYIRSIDSKDVVLDNGERIGLSRIRIKETKKKFLMLTRRSKGL